MTWQIAINAGFHKKLIRIPHKDSERLEQALDQIEYDPFGGDTQKMAGQKNTWRRRVGSYRILYDIFTTEKTILVFDVKRRSSNTY